MNPTIEQLLAFGAVQNVPLSELTSFRIGGPAALVWQVDSAERLCSLLSLTREHRIPTVLAERTSPTVSRMPGSMDL